MSEPLVTAVVLCYNTGEWTIKTIQSIQNNGYGNVEIICIDDASTDGESQKQLKDFHRETQFGILIINPRNIGIPASANKGLALAKGKYMFIIGDDYLLPGKIKADIELLESTDEKSALVHSIMQFANYDFSLKYPDFSPTYSYPQFGPDLSTFEKIIALGGGVAAPTSVFKTKVLVEVNGWDETLKYEDKPMWLKLASRGFVFEFRPEVSVLYRRNNSQVSNQFKDGDLVYQMKLLAPYLNFQEARKQIRKILIYAASAKLDGVTDLSKCVKIYRESVSRYSITAFLASTGILTFVARCYRIIYSRKPKRFSLVS